MVDFLFWPGYILRCLDPTLQKGTRLDRLSDPILATTPALSCTQYPFIKLSQASSWSSPRVLSGLGGPCCQCWSSYGAVAVGSILAGVPFETIVLAVLDRKVGGQLGLGSVPVSGLRRVLLLLGTV